jgi:hypothetical protein
MPPLLHIYLRDHLAGSTFGLELVNRCRRKNAGTQFEAPVAQLAREIASDREALVEIVRRVGAGRSRVKVAVAWALEKGQRLMPSGRPFSYTPLSRVLELESLAAGITGKRALWRTLGDIAHRRDDLEGYDFTALGERAEDQLRRVESLRVEAVRIAFDPSLRDAIQAPGSPSRS